MEQTWYFKIEINNYHTRCKLVIVNRDTLLCSVFCYLCLCNFIPEFQWYIIAWPDDYLFKCELFILQKMKETRENTVHQFWNLRKISEL